MKRFCVSVIQPGAQRLAGDYVGARAAVSSFLLACHVGQCATHSEYALSQWARYAAVDDCLSRTTGDMFSTITITRVR